MAQCWRRPLWCGRGTDCDSSTLLFSQHDVRRGLRRSPLTHRHQFHCMPVTESATKPAHGGRGVGHVKNYCVRTVDVGVAGTAPTTNRRRSRQTKIMNFSLLAANRSILSRSSISTLCQQACGSVSRPVRPVPGRRLFIVHTSV